MGNKTIVFENQIYNLDKLSLEELITMYDKIQEQEQILLEKAILLTELI